MINESPALTVKHTHQLWQTLTAELASVFDAHGVCAVVASEIAAFCGVTAVIGISDPFKKYFDVWICQPDHSIEQIRWDNARASFYPLIEEEQPHRAEKFSRPPAELVHSALWQLPRDHILALPLPVPGEYQPLTPPGLLCLIDPPPDCPLTLENLPPLGTFITTLLDRAFLRHTVHRQDVEFAVVSDISFALTSTLSLQNIYKQLMGSVRRTLNVGSVSVGLIDLPTGDIIFVDMLLGDMFKDLPSLRLKKGQGIAGWVSEKRQPVIINDVYADNRFFARFDRQSGFHTDSMICIPLQVEDRVIGVLQAINKVGGEFMENDLRLLQAIGGPLAAAIENAGLHSEVLAEKRRIETIFASMSEGMLTVNADGTVTHANDALLSLLRQDAENLLGRPAAKMIRFSTGDLPDFMQQVLQEADEYPQLATNLYQIDGQLVPVLVSGAPISHDDGTVSEIIFVFSDLRQIREVERMRDDFFHGIIHELRTPLATILMYARLLREGKAQQKEKADRFLGVIERESDRLQKMVRQMLELAKMEAREFQRGAEPIQLNPLFEEILPQLADRASEKGLTFRQKIQPDLPAVLGSQDSYHLIIKNLVDNAIKFTLSGTVRVDAWNENGSVLLRVQDEGIGIPEQAMPNLFGRFFRAQTAVERGIAGTGLGLYMVKEAVENYNGTITVNSKEGKGTTFTVRLPITEE
ncbi:MAG: GAF domain-containing protein [Anaerolineae bacterium]|nr:GAF domain-containing protein [Anaerolineae bacterium]